MDKTIGNDVTIRPKAERGTGAFVPGDVMVGRYVVEKVLGEGGMGIVYQCLDRVGGVAVAVKCLPPEVSRNADEMEDIRANYRLVADLHHPNIAGARTLELDETTGDYYLVMDLARGVSLKRWARGNPQATTEAKLAILRQVAAALDYAHAEKVIHRDVKPENVMVDDDGRVKVLDFGLAAQIRSSQSRTSKVVTSRSGTWGYMSPEQWKAKPQREQADVYSFGVMAYWMFAGVLPFEGDDPAVLGPAVLTGPVAPVAGLPAHMNAALVKALAKAPEDRFSSCIAFVDALEGRSAAHIGGSGRAVALRPPQGGSRSRATVKIILTAAALILAIAGGWWWFTRKSAAPTGTTGVPPVATSDPTGTTGVSPVAGSERSIASPKAVPSRGSGDLAASSNTGNTKTITLPGGATMEMIYVAPGTFTMGSPSSEEGRYNGETQHRVTLTKGFWLGKYEVTQTQWESVMGENPSRFKGGNRPVDYVSWEDCQRFISKVNSQQHCGARLPTEAEWEFACRAGSTGPYGGNGNLDDMGWYDSNSGRETHIVGQKQANAWGFYDMHGNVWEWCEDWFGDYGSATTDPTGPTSGEKRVLRGGSWLNFARLCRSAYRSRVNLDWRIRNYGFRLCCSAGPRGATEADVTEIAVEAAVQKARMERLDDADGFRAKKDALADVLVRAAANGKARRWGDAALGFTNYVSESKALLALDEARRSARKSKADAQGAKSRASEAGAAQYAGTQWNEANGFLETADGLFGKMSFADAALKYAAAAKQFALCVDEANAEKTRRALRAKWRKEGEEFTINDPYGLYMTMKWCPAGSFTMGSPSTEDGRDTGETQHQVTLTKGFWLGQTEVTQGQWKKVMNGETIVDLARKGLQDDTLYKLGEKQQTLREYWKKDRDGDPNVRCGDLNDNVPVYNVNWHEAVEFCRRLTQRERAAGRVPDGYEYRLPTEAEWEYACRAGTTESLPNGRDIRILGKNNAPALDDIAWYGGNSSVGFNGVGWDTSNWPEKQYPEGRACAREVKGKQPNNWGLYDMIGNVWEWCGDWDGRYEYESPTDPVGPAEGAYRVNRGGSWNVNACRCRSASRARIFPGFRFHNLGFRVALAPSH